MKPVRKAVRTFLIINNKVVAIQYTSSNNKDFYDIPGGKIEEGESSVDAAIREFKEETTMDIWDPKYAGNLIIEYPERIFDIDVYLANEYSGEPSEVKDTVAIWIDIDDLLKKDKIFSIVHLLDKDHRSDLLSLSDFKCHFIVDENHKKIN